MSQPIRVLHAVGNMGIGGIETLIMNIYRNIDREKVQFDFLIHTPTDGEYGEEIKKMGGRLYHMPVLLDKPHVYYWRYFEYKKALKQLFIEHPEIKIVHGHMTNTASIYMPIAMKYGQVKCCIAHSHNTKATPGLIGAATNFLQRNLQTIATDYFACSDEAAKWIYTPEVIASGRVKIIHNGADISKYHYTKQLHEELKEKYGLAGKLVIGNVARYKKVKNHAFMIDIMNEIHKVRPEAVLVLVGQGELMDDIKAKVHAMGMDDCVLFLGARQDVPDLMMAFDVFLLPSLFEGLPLVGIEAQAAGLPLVCSSTVTRETDVTGNVTFIELEKTPAEWARMILSIVDHHERADMTSAIEKAGYSVKETAKWLQDFYIKHGK